MAPFKKRFPVAEPTPDVRVVQVEGPQGPKGVTGDPGVPGAAGATGPTGPAGPVRPHRWLGKALQFQNDDGSWTTSFERT